RVAVVLEEDEERQTPLGRDVERLVDDALAERAVTDANRDDAVLARQFLREREACAHRNDAALHAVAEEPSSAQVLAAADARAHARARPHDLRDQALDVIRPGDEVAMAAMVREDDVALVIEALRKEHGRQLLPDAGMRRAGDLALREQGQQPLLD